jgi:hypothetical protein
MVALFGRLPVVTPVYVYSALIAGAGLVVVPPLISAVAAAERLSYPRVVTTIGLLVVSITIAVAYKAQAYTYDQPLRRQARAFQEAEGTDSIWIVSSTEPGLDLEDDAPGIWSPGRNQRATSVPWGGLREPYVFSATGPHLGPPPADVASFELQDVAGGIEMAITVMPREPGLIVRFYLPDGATPARTNLPGTITLNRWSATYVAAPADGLAFRARFTGVTAERLRETRVAVTSAKLPGGEGWQRLPRWMPQERMVWTARATWVLTNPRPLEPVAPLR